MAWMRASMVGGWRIRFSLYESPEIEPMEEMEYEGPTIPIRYAEFAISRILLSRLARLCPNANPL
jgi:hypothetical protein